ncbi:MAG: hypothetical protein IKW19_08890 [Akkermansia sp.]|nr:hypothetical protein [Akkermansia sp.]
MKTFTFNFTSSQGRVKRESKVKFKNLRQAISYAHEVITAMLFYMADGEELKSTIHSENELVWEECTMKQPKESWQYPFVVAFALRYALWRHSSAPSIVASYISEHWDELGHQRDCILRDLREHLEHCKEWQEDSLNSIDYDTWQRLYNELISKTKAK